MGYILSMMHCRSQHSWELLHPFARSFEVMLKETIRNDDFKRNTALQHCCEWLQRRSNIAALCCAKNRRCESLLPCNITFNRCGFALKCNCCFGTYLPVRESENQTHLLVKMFSFRHQMTFHAGLFLLTVLFWSPHVPFQLCYHGVTGHPRVTYYITAVTSFVFCRIRKNIFFFKK